MSAFTQTAPGDASKAAPGAPRASADVDFVGEIRRFLDSALTPDLREAGRNTIGVHSDIAACRAWHRKLYERGWVAPAWPVAYGGTGWSPAERVIFDRVCAANDAPILFAGGLRTVGPLLIAAGTPQQQETYVPAILDGRDLWCQGFSEAGAGSDLAALQTRAVRDGDHYVVSGAKLWTTGAQFSNRMFCLVRTSTAGAPQSGITFLLIDMASPGLTVAPIRTIDGDSEFCDVRFDGVRVPVENRVGAENDGWSMAKLAMRFARASNTTTGVLRRAFRSAERLASRPDGSGDADVRRKLAALDQRLVAFEALELRLLRTARGDGIGAPQASMLKTLATELHQDIASLILEIAGPFASEAGTFAARKYFATRAASIYSGTNETHRNLIAQHLLRGV